MFELQIFNEFNARKPDELNIFDGVVKNRLFMAIIALTVVLQVRPLDLGVVSGLSYRGLFTTLLSSCL